MSDVRSVISLGVGNRAQRFDLHLPVRYRADSDGDWHKGTIKNISRSGVLFLAEDWAEPRSHLELALLLPKEAGVDRAGEVICRGTVIRAERGTSGDGSFLIAVRISHYRLVRPPDGRRLNRPAPH